MESRDRKNRLAWIGRELAQIHDGMIEKFFPELRGMPPDDGAIFLCELVKELDDEELRALVQLDRMELIGWARQQVQEHVVEGWFHAEAVEVLTDYVKDELEEAGGWTDEEINLAIRYLGARSGAIDLVKRFDDDKEKWHELIRLAKSEFGDPALEDDGTDDDDEGAD